MLEVMAHPIDSITGARPSLEPRLLLPSLVRLLVAL